MLALDASEKIKKREGVETRRTSLFAPVLFPLSRDLVQNIIGLVGTQCKRTDHVLLKLWTIFFLKTLK